MLHLDGICHFSAVKLLLQRAACCEETNILKANSMAIPLWDLSRNSKILYTFLGLALESNVVYGRLSGSSCEFFTIRFGLRLCTETKGGKGY